MHAFNPSIQEAYAGGYLRIEGQAGPQSKIQDMQRYTGHPVSKNIWTEKGIYSIVSFPLYPQEESAVS